MTDNTNTAGGRRGHLRRVALWGGAALLLLTPLVAMQFTTEVAWTGFDFVVMGAILTAACGGIELAVRFVHGRLWRAVAILAVLAAFVLVWAQGAVGIF